MHSTWESIPIRYPCIQTAAFVVIPNHIHGIIPIFRDEVRAIHELPLDQFRIRQKKMLLPR